MKLHELLDQMGIPTEGIDERHLVTQLVILTEPAKGHAIGGTSAVPVESVSVGFDWDAGRLLFKPKAPLVSITENEVRAIRESIRMGTSWHAYQNIKELRMVIADQQAEIAELKGLLAELKKNGS